MDIVSIVVVLGVILAFSTKLDDLVDKRPDFKKEIVTTIINFPTEKYADIVKKSNVMFIQLFNLIYGSGSKERDYYVWIWLFCSFSSSFLLGFMIFLLKITVSLEYFLAYVVICPSLIIFMGLLVKIYSESKTNIPIVLMSFISLLLGYLTVYIIINFLGIDLQNINLITTILIVLLFPGSILIGYFFFYFSSNMSTSYLHISPPRVIISSILVITIIAFLKIDITQSFIFDFNQIGMILLAYLLLNIFADSISLWETNIILRLAARGRIKRFVLLGLLDLFLSAVIFLAIPLSTGNLDIFFDSMWFKGDYPWLGILFWSTFSTSFIFWAFLLAIFVQIVSQKILGHYVKLNKILPIEEKPFTCLYFFSVPFVFLILKFF